MDPVTDARPGDVWPRWIRERLLEAAFQPIVSLRDGYVLAFEGLSRPLLPWGEPVPVLDLITSAEQHDSLLTFDQLAFQGIIAAFCQSPVRDTSQLFINILPKSLLTPAPFLQALQESGLKAEQIVLEISERETIAEGDAKLREYLAPFRNMGIRIALDDMGSGYSGLTRLIELQPDFAKIDLTLVRDIDKNAIKFALLESTARFAKKTAATSLIAEGIETFAELYTLKEIGVEFGQGYLLGKPNQEFHASLNSSDFKTLVSSKPPVNYQLDTLLTTTRQMVRGLAQGEGVYNSLTSLAKKLTGADTAALFKLENTHFRYVASSQESPLPKSPMFHDMVIDQMSALYHAIVTREPAIFQQKSATDPHLWSEHLASVIVAPICDNLGCWGVLHVGYHEPNQIRSDTIHLVESIAALFTLALGYSQKEEAVSEQDMLGEPLFEAISSLAESADLEHLLAKTTAAALAVTGGHEGWIGILHDYVLHCVRHDGKSFDVPRQDLFDPTSDDGRGPVGQVLQTRSARIIPNIMNDPSLAPWLSALTEAGIQSAAGIPLTSGSHLLGILKVYHSRIGGFTSGRVRRLYALSSLATALIERSLNALAFNERIRRQSLLAQSLSRMNYAKSQHEIFSLLTNTLIRYGPFPLALVLARDGGVFVPVFPDNDEEESQMRLCLPYGDDHAVLKALRSDRSLYVVSGRYRQDALTHFSNRHEFQSYAVIPLGILDTAVVLFAHDTESLVPALPELESFTRAMGQALSKNVLESQIAQEQQQMDGMLSSIRNLAAVKNPRALWEHVTQVLVHQIGVEGGWLVNTKNFMVPALIFGQVPDYVSCLLQPGQQKHSPFMLGASEIPLSLREEGITRVLGFHFAFPEMDEEGFLLVLSRNPGFSKHQQQLMQILVSFAESIYKRITMQRQHEGQAQTDILTHLPNQLGLEVFYRKLQHAAEGEHGEVGCVLFDVVDLSQVNHNLGENVGTKQLVQLAHYLHNAVRHEGIAGRIGGDKFMVLYPQISLEALEEQIPELVDESPLGLRWVGIFVSRLRDVPFESVLKLADLTLHHKGSGCLEILAKV